MLNQDSIIDTLCRILQQRAGGTPPSTVLFALYSVITSYETLPPTGVAQQIHASISAFERQAQLLSADQRQLIDLILRRIGISSPPAMSRARFSSTQGTPDVRGGWLYALGQQQQYQLTKQEVQDILAACIDTDKLSEAKRQEVNNASTVQQVAWNLLSQPFNLAVDALSVMVQALDDDEAIVCAAAALLLQRSKKLPPDIRQTAAGKIMAILKDEQLSRRPLDPPDNRVWRLDDVLFETLQVLAE